MQTALRELQEEVGLAAGSPELLGLWALEQVHRGDIAPFAGLVVLFFGGVALGLMSLVTFNARLSARLRIQNTVRRRFCRAQ